MVKEGDTRFAAYGDRKAEIMQDGKFCQLPEETYYVEHHQNKNKVENQAFTRCKRFLYAIFTFHCTPPE